MRYLKMLTLVTGVAALTAFIGVGSASATVLCKTQLTSGCAAAGWDYPAGTVIELSLEGTAATETTGGTVVDTCAGSSVKDTTSNAGSSTTTVSGNITTLTFAECTRTTDVLTNGSLEIHWISGTDNATVTGSGSEWTVNPPLGLGPCVYGTKNGTHIGTLTGGSPATLHIEAIVPLIKDESAFKTCPEDARWTGSYQVTSPEGLYFSTS